MEPTQHPTPAGSDGPSALHELGVFFGKTVIVSVALVAIGIQGLYLYMDTTYWNSGSCNVELLPITGMISSYDYVDETGVTHVATTPESIASELERIAWDDTIVGIIADIDSPGGTPAASLRMMEALAASTKPVVARGGDYITSGGYMAALGASSIVASPSTDVGSIGVTISYLDQTKKNEKDGATWNSLASAPFKDYGSPDKPLTAEERALIERDLKVYHDAFVSLVAEKRGMSVDEVKALADGSSMPGSMALEKKLIDAVGDERAVLERLAAELGMDASELIVCR